MFTNLLVPLNGNPAATTALRTAHALATAPGAHLHLLRVIRPPVAMIDSRADQIREAAGYLDGVARELNTGDVSVPTHVRSGDVADEILTAIGDLRADVVVIPTRGHSGMVRAVLGRVATEILSRSPIPVVLLRADGRQISAIERILVPVDGSPGTALALAAAVDIAHGTGARLTLLHAVAPIPLWAYEASAAFYFGQHLDPAWDAAALAGAQQYVEGLAARLCDQGIAAEGLAVVADPPQAIAETAKDVTADLIVMRTRAETCPGRAILGSVADAVTRSAQPPVLLINLRGSSVESAVHRASRVAVVEPAMAN